MRVYTINFINLYPNFLNPIFACKFLMLVVKKTESWITFRCLCIKIGQFRNQYYAVSYMVLGELVLNMRSPKSMIILLICLSFVINLTKREHALYAI